MQKILNAECVQRRSSANCKPIRWKAKRPANRNGVRLEMSILLAGRLAKKGRARNRQATRIVKSLNFKRIKVGGARTDLFVYSHLKAAADLQLNPVILSDSDYSLSVWTALIRLCLAEQLQ